MIDLNIVEQEILDLEKKDTSYAVIERLAWLYIVRDHIKGESRTAELGESEFMKACSNVPIASMMNVLSEHFAVIEAVYPKEYNNIIRKLNEL